jgi:prepilin-type N-terminal cleavage/methylation domain-containing protein
VRLAPKADQPLGRKRIALPARAGRRAGGFTLIEIAIALVIIGLLLGGTLKAHELIRSARVNRLISQQEGFKVAFFAFQDRFGGLPGDYSRATTNIPGATQNGNNNGRVESATTPNESILAWEHLSRSGFLTRTFAYNATESADTSPVGAYGVYQQIIFDGLYGAGTVATPSVPRHNIKTGSQIPVDIIAEMDRKIDDGAPNTGSFQFSRYQGNGVAEPTDGSVVQPACTSSTATTGIWNASNGSTNCGGASLL